MSQPNQPNHPNQNPQNPTDQPQYPQPQGGGQPYAPQPGQVQPSPQVGFQGGQAPNPYATQILSPTQFEQGGLQSNPYQVPTLAIQPEQGTGGNLGKALGIGLGAMIIGALVWGGLVYFTERFFVYVAVLIGLGVAYALTSPFKKPLSKSVLATLVVPALVLTIVSVQLGNLLALTFFVMKEGATFGEGFSFAISAFGEFITSRDGLLTTFFGSVGAGFSFFQLAKKAL